MAIDRDDHLYIVDMTARIQVFTTDGRFLRGWQTPDHQFGKPTGLSIARDGNVWVADTHYYRVLIYSPEGKLLRTFGGVERGTVPRGQEGDSPASPSGAGRVRTGHQRRPRLGRQLLRLGVRRVRPHSEVYARRQVPPAMGRPRLEPGQFIRPQKMAFDEHDRLWVTDACNHRIQVFDTAGKLLRVWGKEGSGPGELYYPYDLALAPDDTLYVCEFGNHRVQKFTRDGRSLGCFGTEGRGEGQSTTRGLVRDSRGMVYVLDTNNHRVQVVRM